MTWTPSPADEVPNPAGINSLRKMFGFNLSKGAAANKSSNNKRSTQSKGEETSQQQSQEQELQQQELKEDHAGEGQERAEAESSGLSAEGQGDCCPRTRGYVVLSELIAHEPAAAAVCFRRVFACHTQQAGVYLCWVC